MLTTIINVVTESTEENMRVLRDCIEVIIKALPYQFKEHEEYMLYGSELNIESLKKKYKGTRYEDAIDGLRNVTFVFDNRESSKNRSVMGAYIAKPINHIRISVSALMQSGERVELSKVLAKRINKPIATFRAILLHELRHYFQSYLYSKYYYGDRDEDYKVAPIELDAAWSHHLEDYKPSDYTNVSAYVQAVMTSFEGYKKLTDKLNRHFRRKTARYYLTQTKPSQQDPLESTPKERLAAKRDEFKKIILSSLDNLPNTIDLRQIPGYQADRFFFPEHIVLAVRNMIVNAKPVSKEASSLFMLPIAIANPQVDKKRLLSYIKTVHGITMQDVYYTAPTKYEGFDVDTLMRYFKTFGIVK